MRGYYWLASYPKSGNTWLRLVLSSLRAGGAAVDLSAPERFAPIASLRQPFDAVLCLESSDLTPREIERLQPRFYQAQAAEAEEPLIRKVHEAWVMTAAGEPLLPPTLTLGAVYLVRDPRDVAVSLAHHSGIGIDEAIATMAHSDTLFAADPNRLSRQLPQRLLSWSGHVESWLDHANVRLMMTRYEDMSANPAAVFAAVAAFLGWRVSTETLAAALAATRFEVLQTAEKTQGFRECSPKADHFFRHGRVGSWREHLTATQAARIAEVHGRMMTRLGYL